MIGESTKHEELFRLLRLNRVDQALKVLKKELAQHDNIHTIILSTESIVNQLYHIEESRWVEFFEKIKLLGSLELLLIKRDSKGFFKSYYKQAVVNQLSPLMSIYSTPLTLLDFAELTSVRQLVDVDAVVNKLEKVSDSSVRVFDFGSRVVEGILNWLVQEKLPIEVPQISNVSLQPEEVELIRQLNTMRLETKVRNAWFRLLTKSRCLGSSTALNLAGRSKDEDMLVLNPEFLLKVQPGRNKALDVDDEKLSLLASDVYQLLCDFQRGCAPFYSLENKKQVFMILRSDDSFELKYCVHKRLEQLLSASNNILLGENLFENKKLELAPFEAVNHSGWDSWEQDPLNNRSWQWRLNWFSFLPYLLAHHRAVRNDEVLGFGCEAIQSWLDKYLQTDTTYPFEFIWHDHATALRAEQLILFVFYCRYYAPEWAELHAKFLQYMENALVVHGQWLAKDSFYSEHTNHGLEQARVLLLLGTVFDGVQAGEWRQKAIRRISSELNFSFTREGVHVENSPAYHIFVFKVFIGILKDYPANLLGDLAEQFEHFSTKALGFITHILRPDGLLPPIGDTEQLPTSDAYRDMFGDTPEYRYFLYALTQGQEGTIPPALNRVYPQSGYAVFRDRWPSKGDFSNAFHLITKVGCSSRYHHQQDEGHISLYAGGEDWLIDSGLYNYVNNDPVRKYMRSRLAHNVPIIENTRYSESFENRLASWKVLSSSEDEHKPYVSMQIGVLDGISQVRKVLFDKAATSLQVVDTIQSDDIFERNYTLLWHVPSDKKINIDDGLISISAQDGKRMEISFRGDAPDNISFATGIRKDRVLSCISYKANSYESSQIIRVLFKKRLGLHVHSEFNFVF